MTLEDESCYSPSDHGSPPILQTLEAGVLLRDKPMVHPAVDPPLCEMCQKMEMAFFDPNCPGCQDLLTSPDTTLPEIYAVLRQWTPQTQQSLEILIREVWILSFALQLYQVPGYENIALFLSVTMFLTTRRCYYCMVVSGRRLIGNSSARTD